MKAPIPSWAIPLNIFQIHGTMCCPRMKISYASQLLIDNFFCYDARAIHDANFVVLWGSFSKKLSGLILDEMHAMVQKRVLLHIRGCEHRIENSVSQSSLVTILPINRVFSGCILNPEEARMLIREARQCLKA